MITTMTRRLAEPDGFQTPSKTKVVQLTRAALLRAAGLGERPAAAAAIAAGATYTEVGAVLGMTQQGASARIGPYLAARAQAAQGHP